VAEQPERGCIDQAAVILRHIFFKLQRRPALTVFDRRNIFYASLSLMAYGTLHVTAAVPCGRTLQQRRKSIRLRTFVIFCFFLSTICFVYNRFWSVHPESGKPPHDAIPNAGSNCTICLVEVPDERVQKPAIGFDLTDAYGYVRKFALAPVLASFESKFRRKMDAIRLYLR
jgi:hypothetical protein